MNTSSNWRRWTLGEAFAKIISATLQKQIGLASESGVGVVLSNAVIGLVQAVASFFLVLQRKKSIFSASVSDTIFSILFGVGAFLSTMCSMTAYRLGGEVSLVVFIITFSIIPGAFIDTLFFKNHLNRRQWFGVAIGLFGGYLVLGAPGLGSVAKLPIWVLFALTTSFTVAVNQGISQRIKEADSVVKNFWGGLTILILSVSSFAIVGVPSISMEGFERVLIVSAMIGLVTVFMWTCNFNAYKDGALIAEKKLMMNGLYLTFAMIVGVFFYKETLTFGKALGVPVFFVASCFFDNKLWVFFRGLFQKK